MIVLVSVGAPRRLLDTIASGNLTIAEIAHRLGRAEATVKAYLYDPSYANKGPKDSPTR